MLDNKEIVAGIDNSLTFIQLISLYSEEGCFRPIYEVGFDNRFGVLKLSNGSIKAKIIVNF